MNILYTNYHTGYGGGHTTYVKIFAHNPDHNTYVACPKGSYLYQKLEAEGYKNLIPITFSSKLKDAFTIMKTARQLRKFIREKEIDIVHTNGAKDSWPFLFAKLFPPRPFKFVFTKQNSFPVKGPLSKWRHNSLYDGIIFVSASAREALGMPQLKPYNEVIESCVDTAHFSRTTPPTVNDKLHIVSNAGTSWYKRWDLMTEAVLGLPESYRERVKLSILGTITDEVKAALETYGDQFEFTGLLNDTRPHLEQGDIGFVLSDNVETISFACREMISMSLPVIVSDYGSLKDNVDEKTGWIVPTGSMEAVRDLLIKILDMPPEELLEMKYAARRKAEAEFSQQVMYDKTNAFYGLLK